MNVAPHPVRILSLFAGAGGLDLALDIALPAARPVCYVEIDVPAARILAARFADGSLPEAPIWSNVSTFDGRRRRGAVDLIVGGSPCQDLSISGKREGISGRRSGLFWEYLRAVDEVQPEVVFWENVEGAKSSLTIHHRSELIEHLDELQRAADCAETPRERWRIERHRERLHGRLLREHGIPALLYVCCCLEARGYRVEAGQLAASDVGAPHRRERVFVLAHSPLRGLGVRGEPSGGGGLTDGGDDALAQSSGTRSWDQTGASDGRAGSSDVRQGDGATGAVRNHAASGDVADPSHRLITQPRRGPEGRDGAGSAGEGDVGDANQQGSQGRRRDGDRCADERTTWAGSLPLFPPGPSDAAAWRDILAQWPWLAPAVESGVRVLADGMAVVVDAARADQLRAGGNGVVAIQGALAFTVLARRAGLDFWGGGDE